MDDFARAIVFCLLITCAFAIWFKPSFVADGDFQFHYDKTTGNFAKDNPRYTTYAPFAHKLAAFFTYNVQSFYYFILIINGIIVPMLLFKISRRWIVVPLYFAVSNYFLFMFGYLAQSLAGILLLLMFVVKNNWLRLAIVLISIPAHSQGFLLTSVAFLLIILNENRNRIFYPACTGIVGNLRPTTIDTKLTAPESSGMSISNLGSFLTRIIGFPFLLMGILQHNKEGNYDMLVLAALAFVISFFVSPRTLYVIPLLMLSGTARYYYTLNPNHKKLFVALTVLWGIWNFSFWFSERSLCG